ncbi:DoxX family protein [Sphaerisporangium rufum]|uniref:DoxX family protein n=1 Tax=Sphaerisporangium rufum TaxID=1381558 RepID=UPI0035A22B74
MLALTLLGSGYAKLTRHQVVVDSLTGVGVPLGMFPFLAACEIAGAIGLLAGLWLPPLGVAAAAGVVLYFVGAVGTHLYRRDFRGMPNALVILVVAVAVLWLRLATL